MLQGRALVCIFFKYFICRSVFVRYTSLINRFESSRSRRHSLSTSVKFRSSAGLWRSVPITSHTKILAGTAVPTDLPTYQRGFLTCYSYNTAYFRFWMRLPAKHIFSLQRPYQWRLTEKQLCYWYKNLQFPKRPPPIVQVSGCKLTTV